MDTIMGTLEIDGKAVDEPVPKVASKQRGKTSLKVAWAIIALLDLLILADLFFNYGKFLLAFFYFFSR